LAEALETALNDLTRANAELLGLVREHRRAISRSDSGAIQDCISRQGLLATRVADLERNRRKVVAELTGKPTATFDEVAPKLPESHRAGITEISANLRALLTTIQRENSVVRSAAHTLIGHIDGLMQQVARALSHAGTYGRQGRVETVGPVPCGLDMVH
jgi:hypothetical protein